MGGLWVTAEQASGPLGLSSGQQVRKLWTTHKSEFIDGVESARISLDVAYARPSEGRAWTQRQAVLVFSLAGLDHLALLVRNEVGVKLRRWTVDLRASLRAKEKAVVSPDGLEAMILRLVLAAIEKNDERWSTLFTRMIDDRERERVVSAKHASHILHLSKRAKRENASVKASLTSPPGPLFPGNRVGDLLK